MRSHFRRRFHEDTVRVPAVTPRGWSSTPRRLRRDQRPHRHRSPRQHQRRNQTSSLSPRRRRRRRSLEPLQHRRQRQHRTCGVHRMTLPRHIRHNGTRRQSNRQRRKRKQKARPGILLQRNGLYLALHFSFLWLWLTEDRSSIIFGKRNDFRILFLVSVIIVIHKREFVKQNFAFVKLFS